jgi:hypothetical protein
MNTPQFTNHKNEIAFLEHSVDSSLLTISVPRLATNEHKSQLFYVVGLVQAYIDNLPVVDKVFVWTTVGCTFPRTGFRVSCHMVLAHVMSQAGPLK